MLLLALATVAAISAADPAPRPVAVVQARASVRVISGERIRFDHFRQGEGERPSRWRKTVLVIEGKPVAASFVEFE